MTSILFLGTGAADWDIKNDIDRDDFRAPSGILIDGHIMVDCGQGAVIYSEKHKNSDIFKNVDTIFLTHSHSDHFAPECVSKICRQTCRNFTVYGDKIFEKLLPNEENLKFIPLDAKFYDSAICGNYRVTALKSNHATVFPEEQTLHYFFEGEKNIFIGYDGGWLEAHTWEFLLKKHIDVYIADSTCGNSRECLYNFRNFSHNNAHMLDLIYETCIQNKVLDSSSKFILTHFAKTLHPSKSETEAAAKQKNYIAAYDGFEILL